jgi:light-regulated signal transduction histidine kinase (bacteriophytochrome)
MPGQPDQVDHARRDLEEFTSVVSHDLKEPLRGIGTYCELLLEDYGNKLDEDGLRRLRAMHKLCHRLEAMIDNLLAYYRVGQVPPARSEVDLNAVAEQAVDTLWPTIERRHALVRILGPLPSAAVDPTLLGMVLGNLISNALKFNDSPGPWVEIGAIRTQPPTIYVRDNGIGIPPEENETVFTVFRRLHSRKRYDGMGLGLAIVRKIVESYGGRVWLESEVGQGSTFYFSLGPSAPSHEASPVTRPPHWSQRGEHRTLQTSEVSKTSEVLEVADQVGQASCLSCRETGWKPVLRTGEEVSPVC